MMNLKELKEYLQKPYTDSQSFLENVIFPIFGEDNFEDAGGLNMLKAMPELKPKAEASGIMSIKNLGGILIEGSQLDIFDITINSKRQLARSRVDIQEIVRRIISNYSGAFMIFHYKTMEGRWDWRFTFCRKGANKVDTTDAKRYTFLLGPGQSCRTAADNFIKLHDKIEKDGEFDIEDIVAAFDVEALSKEFFKKYKEHYERFCNFVYDHKADTEWFGPEFNEWEEKIIRDYVKKLLGRLVFLHFLQKKGWMGVPADGEWGDGDTEFMRNLFLNASDEQKNNYLDEVLEPLFNDALDTDRTKENDLFDTGVEGFRNVKIPYLNGGLFERDYLDDPISCFPANYFADLFEFFYEYNFTIDENDPNDAQVGVDPEMLGMIFENLLEDNKDKGAFYTPKEIVQYMCKESLIAYLQTNAEDDVTKDAIRQFVTTYDVEVLGGRESELAGDIDQLLLDVKICDPAIGSGAFPMGLLKELFYCRGAINDYANAANIKKHIIQHNIYGVDIEKGAVDIARLRFWLAIIVDEETPHALPNLDFKIMQGNSLLEEYMGVKLDKIFDSKALQFEIAFDDETTAKMLLREHINKYFKTEDHNERNILRNEINNAVKSLVKAKAWNNPKVSNAIESVDLQNNQDFFLWHTWFADVFDKGGFDIVIGNPPYIKLQKNNGYLADLYEGCGFETFDRTGDIYCLFYEKGIELLKKNSNLCYITSNKWMRSAYGSKTRMFFTSHVSPNLLIDFASVNIFENATVDANILIVSKVYRKSNHVKCVSFSKDDKLAIYNLANFVESNYSLHNFKGDDKWILLSKIANDIKSKIEKLGKPLNSWNVFINRGVVTGNNDVFIISGDKRNEILSQCKNDDELKRTEKLIKPLLRGRDIFRYNYIHADKYILATFPALHYNIDDYPAVKNYLLTFAYNDLIESGNEIVANEYLEEYCMHKLSQTGSDIKINGNYVYLPNGKKDRSRKKTNNKWFETQDNIGYWNEFNKPKVIWKIIGCNINFAYDDTCIICNNAINVMTGDANNMLQFVGLMNSKLFDWYLKITTEAEVQGGGVQLYVTTLEKTLIKLDFTNGFNDIVKQRLNGSISDEVMDNAVFDAYGLTNEERLFIINSEEVNRNTEIDNNEE